jgi:ketosteroid isomerase-like protein
MQPAEETVMPGHPTKDEILALETAYWNALCKKDGTTAARLSSDSAIVTGKHGLTTLSKEKMKSLTEEGKWTLNSFEFQDVAFLAPTPDVAILAYTVTQNVTMDGKTQTLRAADSSTWVRGPDGWNCCAHSEAFLG